MFSSYGLNWQCDEKLIGKKSDSIVSTTRTFRYRLPKPPKVPRWTEIVKNFSARVMTKPADKLHAIAGLARRYHAVTHDDYVAGLWMSTLREYLLWTRTPHWADTFGNFAGVTKPEQYRAPTWSWASIDAPVEYPYDRREINLASGWLVEAQCSVELVDPGNPFGAVKAGRLTLIGPLLESEIQWNHRAERQPYLETSKGGHRIGFLYTDDEMQQAWSDLEGGTTVWCLALNAHHDGWAAMALLRSEEGPGEYMRIGLVRSHHTDDFRRAFRKARIKTVVVV
ncbi:hypothetical protein SLS53_004063 [Cytospora paraplurivora]|uniref:Uncharacterized protein n=1 Tax=Cytospora paraplurivora TaxID=2898453 RepID=A0AAN9U8H3_9PEZI